MTVMANKMRCFFHKINIKHILISVYKAHSYSRRTLLIHTIIISFFRVKSDSVVKSREPWSSLMLENDFGVDNGVA